jgi:transposase
MLVAVPPAYTSQQCSACGHTAADNRKTQSLFACAACGHTENADVNAARNIRRRGIESFCEHSSGGGLARTLGQGDLTPVKVLSSESAALETALSGSSVACRERVGRNHPGLSLPGNLHP